MLQNYKKKQNNVNFVRQLFDFSIVLFLFAAKYIYNEKS